MNGAYLSRLSFGLDKDNWRQGGEGGEDGWLLLEVGLNYGWG
jgi:hypothetical protein